MSFSEEEPIFMEEKKKMEPNDLHEETETQKEERSRRAFLQMTAGAVAAIVTTSCAKDPFGMPDGGSPDEAPTDTGAGDGDTDEGTVALRFEGDSGDLIPA